jgi:3-deoxy-D-manno-octulosonic-acid transferase
MIFFYKLVVNLIFVIILPFLPFIYFFFKKRRANLIQRLGFSTGFTPKKPGQTRIWIHALSVGEVTSAVPFVKALKDKLKNVDIVFTVSTKTGFETAVTLLSDTDFSNDNIKLVEQFGYFPFDFDFSIKRVCQQIDADSVVIVETDLWPNFLYETKGKKIKVLLVNARLSQHSLNGYLAIKKFSSMFFSSLYHIMAQSSLDKKRFQALGIDGKKISVTGNIKFDQPCVDMGVDPVKKIKKRFGIQKLTKVVIAGSIHEGEEIVLGRVYKNLKKTFPGLLMIIAPRNIEQCSKIISYFTLEKLKTLLISDMDGSDCSNDVVLVNTMGELSKLYAVCDAAFIGGSMVSQGGHNPLEPAAFGKPVLFGPDMSDFLMISKMLLDNGGAKIVNSAIELQHELEIILKDRQIQEYMGMRNFEVFSGNSGAVQKIITRMEQFDIV